MIKNYVKNASDHLSLLLSTGYNIFHILNGFFVHNLHQTYVDLFIYIISMQKRGNYN